jgi:peptidoglycan/LPS O-acetylase OafA/YrhL
MGNGFMGVTIFFVLSGFILTVTYSAALSTPTVAQIWNYAVARVARIYPLYIFVFVCLMILMVSEGQQVSRGWWAYLLALQTWSPNLNFAFGIDPPGWTIGVETFLYAMFPLVVIFVRPLRQRIRGILILALATICGMVLAAAIFQFTGWADLPPADPASAHRWIYRTPLFRLGDFVLGVSTAMLYLQMSRRGPNRAWAKCATMALVVILVVMTMPSIPGAFGWDVVYAVPSAVLLLALALSPNVGLARLLGSRPLVMLGEVSFAFYLIQFPLQSYIGFPLQAGVSITHVASLGVVLLLLVATSVGLNQLIERPARLMIRNFASTRSAKLL